MQPKIIKTDKLFITGLTGNGSKISEVWNDFDSRYYVKPFPKLNENAHEIRFWQSRLTGKTPEQDKSIHVGFSTESEVNIVGFTTLTLPAAEYAVFDVLVAKGYDSENAAMEKWLKDNEAEYSMLEYDGFEYIIECYNEKFKGGNQPDSVVEIWIPIYRK